MARPRKPKNLKKPSKPKNHSIASMENYLKRVNHVKSENNKKQNKYKADLKRFDSLKNKVTAA